MLDLMKLLTPKSKAKPAPVVEPPKEVAKPSRFLSLSQILPSVAYGRPLPKEHSLPCLLPLLYGRIW